MGCPVVGAETRGGSGSGETRAVLFEEPALSMEVSLCLEVSFTGVWKQQGQPSACVQRGPDPPIAKFNRGSL